MSDAGDWTAILGIIAAQIAAIVTSQASIRIIDVGAGLGANSAAVAKLLLTRYSVVSEWDLVEPDDQARAASRNQFSRIPGIPGSAAVFSDVTEVPSSHVCDVALLMHSSYEITYFTELVHDLLARLNVSTIIALAIPSSSPFFLLPEQPRTGCSDQIECLLHDAGFRTRSQRLTSRIRMLPQLLEDAQAVAELKLFTRLDWLSDAQFVRLVRTRWGKEVDFGDSLIIATR